MALSSDPDVWNAVMKNEVVQGLEKSFYKGLCFILFFNVSSTCSSLQFTLCWHVAYLSATI